MEKTGKDDKRRGQEGIKKENKKSRQKKGSREIDQKKDKR